MKKTYLAPLTEVVKLKVGEMLQTGSIETKGVSTDGTGFTPARKDDYDYDEDLW